ncbi:MAG TPA: M1 family aminopeptidase [Myxococcota bacterium]|nr:M1 family aminopeptidase [Myxococcota bacterium]
MWWLACFSKAAEEPVAPVEQVVEVVEVPGAELLRDAEGFIEVVGPLHVLPRYELDLSISDVANRYEGRGTITWTNTTDGPISTLPLLLHPNAPKELGAATTASLELRRAESPGATLRSVRPTLAELDFASPIPPGGQVAIEVEFGGTLKLLTTETNDVWAQASAGMSQGPIEAADYGLLGQGDGLLTAASAFPTIAPYRDGAFQTPPPSGIGDLAWNAPLAFDVRVVTPVGLRVVTNLVDSEPKVEGDVQVVEGVGVGARDLVLIASRDFHVSERRLGDVLVRSWGLSRDAQATDAALADATMSLQALDERIADYPFTELDVVEATLTGGAGGVEFSSLILVAGFLYRDPTTSQDPTYQMLQQMGGMGMGVPDMTAVVAEQRRFVVAHEVAHQWFPGLVGSDAHDQPALDEPLAQYLAGTVLGDDLRDRSVKANFALFRLMDGQDAAAARPTTSFSSTLEYAALVYGKAPYLYVDLEEDLGRDALDRALRAATEEHAWELVGTEDWLSSLERHGATDATGKGRRWWKEAWGDEDFGLDPEGHAALRILLGEEMAEGLEQGMKFLGMSPKDLFAMLGVGGAPELAPVIPGQQPSPEEMLELLEALEQ